MAIYHLEAKVVSRGNGRSAVAASAYMSCSAILNDYDGVQHDFTRKQGLVWQQIFLPDYAPQEWQDRADLWNAVEENEKTKDSRLAREFIVALPIELNKNQWQELLTDFIQNQFVADGMCADVAIHDTDGHNPHAHIMLTVRPLDQQGKWQYKTEKEYLCNKNGEERGFTAAEFKRAQTDGWEKQYQYKVGKKKVYMAPSAAKARGYERASKYPKSTKYGRQNPISERWNSDEQLVLWRAAWADTTNRYLELAGIDQHIDHRSNADRGIDEQPTIHEGVVARALEKKGIVSDRCELNRQIKADNALLRALKSEVKKLMDAAQNTIPILVEKLESLRQNILVFCYQLNYIRTGKSAAVKRLKALKPELARYTKLTKQIKETSKERKRLIAEKKETSSFNFPKLHDLTRGITEATELLEELRTEKAMLLRSLESPEDDGGKMLRKSISDTEARLKKLEDQEQKYTLALDDAMLQYMDLKEQASDLNPAELLESQQAIRPEKERATVQKLQDTYGRRYSPATMAAARKEAVKLLDEDTEVKSAQQRIIKKETQLVQKKAKAKDDER